MFIFPKDKSRLRFMDKKAPDELDKRIIKVQKSTRTTFPFLLPVHNWFRMHFRWYYNWHLFRVANVFHVLLFLFIIVEMFIGAMNHYLPKSKASGSSSITLTSKAEWQAGTNVQTDLDTTPSSIQLTSTTSNNWVERPDIPTPRYWTESAVVNDKIYVIGGRSGILKVGAVEEYDPTTNSWATKASMLTPRAELSVATVNGKIYAIGGNTSTLNYTRIVEEYDPATDSWTTKASMPQSQGTLSAQAVNGKIYVFGDMNTNVFEYNPDDNTWTVKSAIPFPGYAETAATVNNKIYTFGGRLGGVNIHTVEEYDPATDGWTAKADMPTARYFPTSTTLGGKIYVIGGISDTIIEDVVEVYDPVANTWSSVSDMQFARYGLTAEAVNGKIYVIGGDADGYGLNSEKIEQWPKDIFTSPGTHTSATTQIDTGAHSSMNWTTFSSVVSIPTNTSISYRFRTSADASTWSAWSSPTLYATSIDLSGLAGQRYLQVETALENSDQTDTPRVDSYTANFGYNDGAIASCEDGIQNQDETGVDCGGVCPACSAKIIVTVVLTPQHSVVSPGELITYTAKSSSGNSDVTNNTTFNFTSSAGGEFENQSGNSGVLKAGDVAGVYPSAIRVRGIYMSETAYDYATLEVVTAASPTTELPVVKPPAVTSSGCTGLCAIQSAITEIIQVLGSSMASSSTAYTLLILLSIPLLIIQSVHFTRDLIAPFIKGRDKRYIESLIYDSVTGLPVKGAKVELIEEDSNKHLAATLSNSEGKYAFDVSPNKNYRVKVEKGGFVQFTEKRSDLEKAGLRYTNNYLGGNFQSESNEYVFNKNIPLVELDPDNAAKLVIQKSRINSILFSLNLALMLLGTGLTIIILINYPTVINYIILSLYALSFLLFLSRIIIINGRDFGMVVNLSAHKTPVAGAIIRAIRTNDHKLAKTTVSKKNGKFSLALPRGNYELYISKQGLKQHNPLNISIESSFHPRHDEIDMERKPA